MIFFQDNVELFYSFSLLGLLVSIRYSRGQFLG